jgi:hypothetical protein
MRLRYIARSVRLRCGGAVVHLNAKEIVLGLVERVDASGEAIGAGGKIAVRLSPGVV